MVMLLCIYAHLIDKLTAVGSSLPRRTWDTSLISFFLGGEGVFSLGSTIFA